MRPASPLINEFMPNSLTGSIIAWILPDYSQFYGLNTGSFNVSSSLSPYFWYKSDQVSYSSNKLVWVDQSGNGTNATANTAGAVATGSFTLNGFPTTTFSGTSPSFLQTLTYLTPLTSSHVMCAVVRCDNALAGTGSGGGVLSPGNTIFGDNQLAGEAWGITSGVLTTMLYNNYTGIRMFVSDSISICDNNFHIVMTYVSGGFVGPGGVISSSIKSYTDNPTPDASGYIAETSAEYSANEINLIGRDYSGATYFSGSIAECLVFPATTTNVALIPNLYYYLQQKYNITNPKRGGLTVGVFDQTPLNHNYNSSSTANSAPTYVANYINGHPVLQFNGSTTGLYGNGGADWTNNGFTSMSIACVFNSAPTQLVVPAGIVYKSYSHWSYGLYTNGTTYSNRIIGWFGDVEEETSRFASNAILTGSWRSAITTVSGALQLLYIDGNQQNITGTSNGASLSPTGDGNAIGCALPTAGNAIAYQWSGSLAEVVMFNRALTQTEVSQMQGYFDRKYFPQYYLPGIANPTPANIRDLVAWYDFSTGLTTSSSAGTSYVVAVADQSGHNRNLITSSHAGTAGPVLSASSLNGKSTIVFDGNKSELGALAYGTNSTLDGTDWLLSSQMTIGCVLMVPTAGSTNNSCAAIGKIYTNYGFCLGFDWSSADGGNVNRTNFWVGLGVAPTAGSHAYSNSTMNDGVWHTIIGTYTGVSGSNCFLWIDGVLQTVSGSTGGTTSITNYTADAFGLGGELYTAGNTSLPWSGSQAEICIYNRAITSSEVQVLHSYFKNKWNII